VTYSNEAKQRLVGVDARTLEKFGAVSGQTAREMAEGAARAAGAGVALSAAGILGGIFLTSFANRPGGTQKPS